jgi:SSS family transporter
MNTLVLAGVLGYMAAMLAVGWWSSRRVKTLDDFLVAGRRLPYGLATATLFATWFGAGSCMGASGTAYTDGILGVICDPFAAALSLVLAGLFYVALLRRLRLLTVTDLFGRYYGKGAEIFASVLMVPVYIGWLGSQMVALGVILQEIAGVPQLTGVLIGGAVVLAYTLAGGMWAVTLTDLVQVVVLVLGLLILLPVVLGRAGGIGGLMDGTPSELWRFFPASGAGTDDWMAYLGQWALMGLGCVVGQDLIQRSLASRSERVAKHSAVTAGVCYLVMGSVAVLIGLAGRLVMPGLEDPEQLMPKLALECLHPVVVVVFLGALVSAIMSSSDSSLLAAASLTVNNIVLRLFPSRRGQGLAIMRIATILLAILSIGVALAVNEIYSLMVNSWATLLVGIFVPVTAALYWRKANAAAAWVSMIAGTGTWLIYILVVSGDLLEIEDPLMYRAALYGGVASLAGYVVTTLVRYSRIAPVTPACEEPAADA